MSRPGLLVGLSFGVVALSYCLSVGLSSGVMAVPFPFSRFGPLFKGFMRSIAGLSAWALCLLTWSCEAVCVGGILGCGFLFVSVLGHGIVAGAALRCRIHPGDGKRGPYVWGTRLELSGVAPLCEGLVSDLPSLV